MYASIGSMIINVVLNYLLIPYFGFVVAGYTTLLSYILFAFSNYLAMKKIFIKKGIQNNLYDYKTLMLIIILFIVIGFCGVLLYSYLVIRLVFLCVGIVIIFVSREKLFALYNTFRKG